MKKIYIIIFIVLVVGVALFVVSKKNNTMSTEIVSASAVQQEVVIGVLSRGSAFTGAVNGFKDGLMKNISKKANMHITYIEPTLASDKAEDILLVVQDLVSKNPSMIVAVAPDMILAAKKATVGTNIPVLYVYGGDPVDSGFIKSLENSGNNLTGVTWNSLDLSGKRIEILKRIIPSMETVLVLGKKTTSSQVAFRSIDRANSKLKLSIVLKLVDTKEELVTALSEIDSKKIDGITIASDPLFARYADIIIQTGIEKKIPVIYPEQNYAEIGALASYGSEFYSAGFQLSLSAKKVLVDKIAPNMIPSEKTQDIQFVLNNDTATKIGVTFPEDVISVANKVITSAHATSTAS